MTTLASDIKAKALELGFAKAGIAAAGPLGEEGIRLREWLSRGYEAGMRWMTRNKDRRTDPTLVLPGAKSVIVLAMNYYTDVRHTPANGGGKVSRYAWGDDYHDVVLTRIETLIGCIKEMAPEAVCRPYVDTGPVMEKAWAERAGLGWRGKHTNLITRELGSWVFLGEILTTLDLEPDTPGEDHCGTCTACIEACPTDAIVEPYVLDANKCISYLTIEHRGNIRDDLGRKFEGWVYGCDICQDVCPWNSFQRPATETAFQPREGNVTPDLRTLTELSQEEFSARFRNSPVKRAKREGLQRNARIVLETQQQTHQR